MKPRNTFIGAGALAVALSLALPLSSQVQDGILPVDAPAPAAGTLGGPIPGLSETDLARWQRGRQLFDHDFHRSDGLGLPEMNADSCRACHQQGAIGGGGGLDLNVSRFARDHAGAGPYEDLVGGQGLSKLRPPFAAGREEYDAALADVFEQRQTPALFGAGLIESIFTSEILANADPADHDGDGIRGRPRRVLVAPGVFEVGRFGWKAQISRLDDFLRDAMGNELGITTAANGRLFAVTSDADGVADPELSESDADDLLFYMANLAPPARVGSQDLQVLNGELLFESVGCAKCHVPTLFGPRGPVNLYSDLLLHRIMPTGFRGMSEEGAGPGVYQTKPLWGIRHSAPYLHDGRAETLHEAIVMHDGEALLVRQAYEALPALDQEALVAFLRDL